MSRTAIFIIGGLLLAACGTGTSSQSSSTAVADSEVVDLLPTTSGPAAAETESSGYANLGRLAAMPESEAVVIVGAQNLLMSRCMSSRGYEYVEDTVVESNASALDSEIYPSEDVLREFGYGWQMSSPAHMPPAAPQPVDTSVEYQAALDACGSQAAVELDSSRYGLAQQSIVNASGDVASLTVDDPLVTSALAAWSDCMAEFGYTFANPDDAWYSTSDAPTSADSIDLAVTDYSCQRRAQLEETRRAVTRQNTQLWIESNFGLVQELRDALAELTATAQSILDQG